MRISLLLLIWLPLGVFSQNFTPQARDSINFYMRVNGESLNSKVNWEEFNEYAWVKKIYQKLNFEEWSDLSETGIDYTKTQYQYIDFNDSMKSFVALLPVKNKGELERFLRNSELKGIEVENEAHYQWVPLNNNTFAAWDDENCIVVNSSFSYSNVWKTGEDELRVELDTLAIDNSFPSDVDLDDVTEEVELTKEQLLEELEMELYELQDERDYLEYSIPNLETALKEESESLEKIKKEILQKEEAKAYVEEHGELPYTPLQPPISMEEEGIVINNDQVSESITEENATKDIPYGPPPISNSFEDEYRESIYGLNEMDSLHYISFQLNSLSIFDLYFNSIPNTKAISTQITSSLDPKADAYFWWKNVDYDSRSAIFRSLGSSFYYNQFYYLMPHTYLSDSNISGNLYFKEKDFELKVYEQFENKHIQKSMAKVYDQKFNRKLQRFIDHRDLVTLSSNTSTKGFLDYVYGVANAYDEKQNFKEKSQLAMIMEFLKVILDEKAISKMAPGNSIFTLHSLHEKEVTYEKTTYDENFEPIFEEDTKTVYMPNFSFAFVTKDKAFWSRMFAYAVNILGCEDLQEENGNFHLKFGDEDVLSELHLVQKNGVVLIASSLEGVKKLNGKSAHEKTEKSLIQNVKNNSIYMQMKPKDLIIAFENEFKLQNGDKGFSLYQYLINNAGDLEYFHNYRNLRNEYKIQYHINDQHTNSLMYYFNLLEEIYKSTEPDLEFEQSL